MKELLKIQSKPVVVGNVKITKKIDLTKKTGAVKLPCRINVSLEMTNDFSFSMANNLGEEVVIGFDKESNQFFIDRSKSGKTDFEKGFGARHTAPRFSTNAKMNISLVIDVASVELFADDGLTVMTDIFFPNKPYNKIYVSSAGSGTLIKKLEYIKLKSTFIK